MRGVIVSVVAVTALVAIVAVSVALAHLTGAPAWAFSVPLGACNGIGCSLLWDRLRP